jgi:hypothetical protein
MVSSALDLVLLTTQSDLLALALALIEMKGVVDLSTNPRLFLPAVKHREASGRSSTAIMTRRLNSIPYRSNRGYGRHKKGKRWQQFFKTFQLKNSCSENNNQPTGLWPRPYAHLQ